MSHEPRRVDVIARLLAYLRHGDQCELTDVDALLRARENGTQPRCTCGLYEAMEAVRADLEG